MSLLVWIQIPVQSSPTEMMMGSCSGWAVHRGSQELPGKAVRDPGWATDVASRHLHFMMHLADQLKWKPDSLPVR